VDSPGARGLRAALSSGNGCFTACRVFQASNPANSLVAQGIRLTELGQFDAALAADREAVQVYTTLTSSDNARYRDSWERAVNNVVVNLKNLGWSEQAIAEERSRLGLPEA
jgi:hypothetical protein